MRDFIRALDLPPAGRALDFGCGKGPFTQVLRDALPDWEVCGADISRVALSDAALRCPKLQFLHLDLVESKGETFDFLLTHHVLEHVQDLADTWGRMDRLLEPAGAMLHILPCGHAGSLEHRLAGLGRSAEARPDAPFYYEDPNHLRRCRERDITAVAEQFGMRLARARYKDHFWGGLRNGTDNGVKHARWITKLSHARDIPAALKLIGWRAALTALAALRLMPQRTVRRILGGDRSTRSLANLLWAAPLYPLGRALDETIRRLAEAEWHARGTDRSGAEMYLFYTRPQDLRMPEPS